MLPAHGLAVQFLDGGAEGAFAVVHEQIVDVFVCLQVQLDLKSLRPGRPPLRSGFGAALVGVDVVLLPRCVALHVQLLEWLELISSCVDLDRLARRVGQVEGEVLIRVTCRHRIQCKVPPAPGLAPPMWLPSRRAMIEMHLVVLDHVSVADVQRLQILLQVALPSEVAVELILLLEVVLHGRGGLLPRRLLLRGAGRNIRSLLGRCAVWAFVSWGSLRLSGAASLQFLFLLPFLLFYLFTLHQDDVNEFFRFWSLRVRFPLPVGGHGSLSLLRLQRSNLYAHLLVRVLPRLRLRRARRRLLQVVCVINQSTLGLPIERRLLVSFISAMQLQFPERLRSFIVVLLGQLGLAIVVFLDGFVRLL